MIEAIVFIALMVLTIYIIVALPFAIVWVLIAVMVRWLTGWKGLLPASVWCKPGREDPWETKQ